MKLFVVFMFGLSDLSAGADTCSNRLRKGTREHRGQFLQFSEDLIKGLAFSITIAVALCDGGQCNSIILPTVT